MPHTGEVVDALGRLGRPEVRLRQAVVTATAAGPPPTLSVRLGDQTASVNNVRYLASYATPAVNDVVWVLQTRVDLLVLGRLA